MNARILTSLDDPALPGMLNNGMIGIIPTDTIYGLVGAASNSDAIHRMYHIKERTRQPGTTIAANPAQLIKLGFPATTITEVAHYWPAALSVEMSAANIPEYLSTGQPVMAARVPDLDELHSLLEKTGPLMTTSANHPGEPAATNIQAAIDYFGDEVDFYVDTGDLGNRPPSTIIGLNDDGSITIYRQGAVKISSN
jgi:L-threonylcarbamoyladenylate synthase